MHWRDRVEREVPRECGNAPAWRRAKWWLFGYSKEDSEVWARSGVYDSVVLSRALQIERY
jgi:hypothetical protein